MKKPAKTAAELEAIIRVEMEEICDWPTDIAVSVRPDGDIWKVVITHESRVDDSDRFEMIQLICDRLRSEFDLCGGTHRLITSRPQRPHGLRYWRAARGRFFWAKKTRRRDLGRVGQADHVRTGGHGPKL